MATTIEPEGDPTFLAYERARQYGENTLKSDAAKTQARSQEDAGRDVTGLALEQAQSIDGNTASYRSSGFGQSGLRAQAEDRIRSDIALRLGAILSGAQRTSQDASDDLALGMAQSGFDREEQALQARARLTKLNAESGVGL